MHTSRTLPSPASRDFTSEPFPFLTSCSQPLPKPFADFRLHTELRTLLHKPGWRSAPPKLPSLPPSPVPCCLLPDFTPGICSPAENKTKQKKKQTEARHKSGRNSSSAPAAAGSRAAFPSRAAPVQDSKVGMFRQTGCEGQGRADAGRWPSKEGKSHGGTQPALTMEELSPFSLPRPFCACSPVTRGLPAARGFAGRTRPVLGLRAGRFGAASTSLLRQEGGTTPHQQLLEDHT